MNRAKPKPPRHANLEEQVFVSLLRTADALSRAGEAFLKTMDLSPAQYNVLRILRGAGQDGLACREIAGRMISRDPDITRLLDRLESRGLIARARETEDRRVVKTRISEKGLALLAELDAPVEELHHRQLGHMSATHLEELLHLLDRARERVRVEQESQ